MEDIENATELQTVQAQDFRLPTKQKKELIFSKKPMETPYLRMVFSASSRSTVSTVVTPFSCIVTP